MPDDYHNPPHVRTAILAMLEAGHGSPSDIAPLAGCTRHAIRALALARHIDWRARRTEALRTAWDALMNERR